MLCPQNKHKNNEIIDPELIFDVQCGAQGCWKQGQFTNIQSDCPKETDTYVKDVSCSIIT